MSGINRTPGGLLAFLDMKSRGQVPAELGPVVQPTLDILHHYELGQAWLTAAVVGAPVAGSYTQVITVPPGEVWLWRLASIRHQVINPGTCDYCLTAGPSNSLGQGIAVAFPGVAASFVNGANAQGGCVWQPSYPMLADSGFSWGALCTQFSGTHTLTVSVLYTRYRN